MPFLPPATPMGPPAQTPRKHLPTPSSSVAATPLKTPHRTPGGSIEQTSSTPIIDISAIECQKENVQPLARGRSAHALSNTLTMQHKQRQAALNSQRAEFEQLVTSPENQDSDDPLEAWTKYVKWCIDNYPSGQTHESGLVPLLERATRNFKDSEQYINDSRYLRLWILYARNVESARDIYNFLLANEIGTKLASLYEELAVVNEGQNMFEEADKIYRLGIARRANPIDRLKRRYAEYQQRILLHPQAASANSGQLPQNYSEALRAAMTSCGRSVLGHKDSSAIGPSRSNSANVLRGAGARIGSIGSSGAATANNGRKLAVFQDDDEEKSGPRPSGPSSGGWDDVGTAASRAQENLQPDRLGSKALKIGASGGTAKKPGSGIAVFRDSDDDEDADDANGASGSAHKVLNPKDLFAKSESSKAPTETDLLRRNPLMHWESNTKLTPNAADLDPSNARKISTSHGGRGAAHARESKRDKAGASTASSSDKARKSSKPSSSRSASASAGSTLSKQERHACPLMLLYPGMASLEDAAKNRGGSHGHTDEVCLEELLALRRGVDGMTGNAAKGDPWAYLDNFEGQWLAQSGQLEDEDVKEAEQTGFEAAVPMGSQVDAESEVQEPQRSRVDTDRSQPSPEPIPVERKLTTHDTEPTSTMPSKDVYDPDNSFNNAVALGMRPKKKKNGKDATMRHRMSPTLVTKATMLEVENMFNGEDSESDTDDDDSDESSEEDENDIVASLPPASLRKPRMMPISAADIPPTPTPIGRHFDNTGPQGDENHWSAQMHDENAGVRATPMRPTVLSAKTPLGAATPMRTPLGSKTSMAGPASASKPVYRDEDDEDDDEALVVLPTRQPANAFETPMPAARFTAARRTFEPMLEEDEESGSEPEQHEAAQEDEDGSDEDAEYQPDQGNFRAQFQPLTPITEATYEMTRYTAISQGARTPATARKSSSRGKVWRHSDEEDDDDNPDEDVAASRGPSPAKASHVEQGQDADEVGSRSHEALADVRKSEVGEEAFMQSHGDASDSAEVHGPLLASQSHRPDSFETEDDVASNLSSSMERSARTPDDRTSWGKKADFELTEGLTIARDRDDETGNLRSYEQLGKSFVIEDRDQTLAGDASLERVNASGQRRAVDEPMEPSCGAMVPLGLSDFRPPNPCSPVDPDVLAAILSGLSPPLLANAQYVNLCQESADGRLAALQKRSKTEFRRSVGGSTYGSRGSGKDWTVDIAGANFQVLEKIGEGGYGAVFLAEDIGGFAPSTRKKLLQIEGAENLDSSFAANLAELSLSVDEEEEERQRMLAIKAESPPNPWEFYVLDKMRRVLESRIQPSIISARKFVSYADESFLLLDYGEKGTLLEVVNQAASAGVATMGSSGASAGGVEEVLAMFFTIELLKVVEALHSHQLIHGDLKIDNCLLRLDDAPPGTTWSNAFTADGSSGWAQKGLTLIDFGRAIDMSLYPRSQSFVADWTPDARDCVQMREARPFTYQPDYHGIASVAFCLLFGKYIETTSFIGEDGDKRWKITASLRRYWQVDLWNRLFDLMLNPPIRDGEPILDQMRECREEMQSWLEANCNRGGKNLKGLIRKLEIWAMKRSS